MATTKDKHKKQEAVQFTPSVNILRDKNRQLNYIPTPNGKLVYNQLINNYRKGIRAFNIIGAYGIGKSAFLWALEKQLNNELQLFASARPFSDVKEFETIAVVGEPDSIIGAFAELTGIAHRKSIRVSDILQTIDSKYKVLAKEKKGFIIYIDEFGKFLEFASENNPSRELYFIQQLAEYVNGGDKNIFLITTLHQDFNGYARDLTQSQQNEWDKVKGRLKEVTFNEPVEQLVFLAAERLKDLIESSPAPNFKKLFAAVEKARVFPLKDYFNQEVAQNVLPFDILSIAVMTLALQKYGQNERSLFSFIESSDHYGLIDYRNDKAPYYNLSHVYDYLIHNYYSFLTTKFNPNYTQWSAIRTAIERVEGTVQNHILESIMVVKAIGLLNIFAPASSKLDMVFLLDYCQYALGIRTPEPIIRTLEKQRIIRFVKHLGKFILFEGTDLDIELAIDEAGNLVERVTSVIQHLNQYFDFPYISAKAAYYRFGTPRFFAFYVSEKPSVEQPVGDIDGYINLIFSENITEEEIREYSRNCPYASLFGWYRNTAKIRNLIFEIDKIKRVKEDHIEDKVVVRELDIIMQHQVRLLNHYVLGNIYSSASPVSWYVNGESREIVDRKTFNRILSEIAYENYPGTPVYRNEMVNKSKLSSPIVTARKNFMAALVDNWHEEDFGFDKNKFPPEKTIYLSLLRESGMHFELENGGFALGKPTNEEYKLEMLWTACESFLESTKHGKRSVFELVQLISRKPFKLKQGFIDFWLAVLLFMKRNEFALFHEDIYVPFMSQETLELVIKDPKEYSVKQFDIEGVRTDIFNSYRALLNLSDSGDKPVAEAFIETIRPFLTFYKRLPAYAKNTQTLSPETRAFREAIATAKDPEEVFFVAFPAAMGYEQRELQNDLAKLNTYSEKLQASLAEIRGCYRALVARVEEFIQTDITGSSDVNTYREDLRKRFTNVKKHLLLPYQKVFYQRLYSEISDNDAWLNSITQACIGKPLEDISDTEEKVLYEKLKNIVHELDNLDELGRTGFDENKEIAFKLEVTSFVEGLNKNLVRLPIGKNKELVQLQSVVKARLTDDKQLNIATLTKILEDLLKDEKEV